MRHCGCLLRNYWVVGLALMGALATFICILPYNVHGAAGTGTSPAGEGGVEVLGDPRIDRVMPSKPDDLFVVLKNGLTVLVRESHASSVVSTQVLVETGSIYEGDRIPGGLSHYLEHVVSGGTTSKLTETQINERLQLMGGVRNAYTGYEHTVYYIKTTKTHYKEALSLLLGYVSDCQFDQTEHEREKGVILQEYQMGENNPSRQLWHLFMKTAYRAHPVRYPVIGERNIFLQMSKDDLVAHYNRWYKPEHMVISVAGDVQKHDVLDTVMDIAGSWERSANPPYVLPAEPPQLQERRVEKSLPMAMITQVQMGFQTVDLNHPDLYPLDVLAVIMGDGRMSKLYRAVRDDKGLVLSIGAGSWTPTFVNGQFLISMDLDYENLSKAVDAVWQEILHVQENPVSDEALERAKNKVKASRVFSEEMVQSQATRLASDWVATGDPYFSENYVSRIQDVSPEDILQVARKYFQRDLMTLAVVKPGDSGSDLPPVVTEPCGSTGGIQKMVLSNQMTLLLKRSTAAPIVVLNFVLKGGLRFEPADKPGLSHFMAALLTKGTQNRSKIEVARAIEDLGGSIQSSSGHNTVSVSVSVLKEHLPVALDVLSDVILNPSFPAEEIEKQRKETLLAIQRLDEQWTTEIMRLFKRHYYRQHPYKNDVLGSEGAVRRFSREDVRHFYRSVFLPNNAVLAVFGDIDEADVTSRVEEALKDFEPGIVERPIIEAETRNISQDEIFEIFNEKTSAALLVGYNGLTLGDRDRPALDVLDAIVSGISFPSGWLYDALRGGDKNLVYVVHAYPAFGIDGGYFGVIAQTTMENYDDVLHTIVEKMALITRSEVDAQILERAKAMCVNAHEMNLEGIAAQASSAALNEILDLGYDYDTKYPGLIEEVTVADVLRVGKDLFSHHLIVATKPRPEN